MKNITTPRTLADCEFTTGYPTAYVSPRDRVLGVLLACAIGIALGLTVAFNI